MLDLLQLQKDGILTPSTLQWIRPLWEQELAEAAEIKEEMLARGGGFLNQQDDNDDDEEEKEDLQTLSTASIHNLEDVSLSFAMDDQSAGHGDRVWHASIAMCLYLKRLLADDDEQLSSSFRSLELGAGTALPSLFLAHADLQRKKSTADDDPSSSSSSSNNKNKPFIHITDAKQYRNLRQILVSLSRQPSTVRNSVQFRVSPHNWGEVLEERECSLLEDPTTSSDHDAPNNNKSYDLVIVSDCLYNPTYHESLLESIASTLRVPSGRAVISFSLHGNTPDDDIWTFVEETINNYKTIGKTRVVRQQKEDGGAESISSISSWRLQARPIPQQHLLVPSTSISSAGARVSSDSVRNNKAVSTSTTSADNPRGGITGWNMEETMKKLDLWVANMDPKRWFAYIYEVTWVPMDEEDDDVAAAASTSN